MIQNITIAVSPADAENNRRIISIIAEETGIRAKRITGFHIQKKSIDARSRQPRINLQLEVFFDQQPTEKPAFDPELQNVSNAKHVVIVGAGPAGIFAAIRLINLGYKPIILERGKDVRSRRRDLAAMNKEGIVNPESNYCFGEGGAGTYSDGKLYTRSTKRGNVQRILQLFHHFGADERILYEAHPHIGTNKLPQIITAMREAIIACGGEVLFESKLTDIVLDGDQVKAVRTADGKRIECSSLILATGHSARDIFELLHRKQIEIECKPFALGVRIEHPQWIIDQAQYHCDLRDEYLPPASYSLVSQEIGRGVFSFCMCPGGIIAPAATSPGELVVNGWSPSRRNNPFANSGTVVAVDEQDFAKYGFKGPLAGMHYQQMVEKRAFEVGGGNLVAPAQRMIDFVDNKVSSTLPECSYLPGVSSAAMKDVLPKEVKDALQKAMTSFGKKMKGYYTNEAILVATESRTSSPVRIPRDKETLQHPQIKGLYPCAEGAGYAGGIVSAAIDGERCAEAAVSGN
ncbi:NAD(P)/FAD-dependent oxidoreductase [Taibaiella soli]|uniref:FAD-binding protein n=1 Tax=Taibaiella soli TaxID=1649169 RepID=A0A2W2BMV2_9BACT|nr:FAD-binding protein [Taibaiella soli]PZF74786.1 FAD-binding protein [Taibaiella soli]